MSSIENHRPLILDQPPLVLAKPPTHYGQLLDVASRACPPALRIALGSVYVWFGMLKVLGVSPIAQLVRDTVPFVTPPAWFVPAVGVFEVAIGVWLLVGRRLRLMLPFFVAHMFGTFGVYVVQPGMAFQHGNPMVLTATGEFVLKNLVLLAAGVMVATRADWRRQ
jgi:putative oxidoreductase